MVGEPTAVCSLLLLFFTIGRAKAETTAHLTDKQLELSMNAYLITHGSNVEIESEETLQV